jgi:DNA repair ATPase RecN
MKTMEVCSDGHPPIAHQEGWKNCPMCALKSEENAELVEARERIEELADEVDIKEMELAEMEHQISVLKKLNDEKHHRINELEGKNK